MQMRVGECKGVNEGWMLDDGAMKRSEVMMGRDI